jgi:hypothetical protein
MNIFTAYPLLAIDIGTGAADLAAVKPEEIIANLNADATFSAFFTAETKYFSYPNPRLVITQKKPISEFRFLISRGGADTILQFNKRAGVAELPSYYDRHSIDFSGVYPDGQCHLIKLDPSGSDVDADIIDNAVNHKGESLGLDSSVIREDWEILRGRVGYFIFSKTSVDGSNRPQVTIEYPAGALVGDLAVRKTYTYAAATNTVVNFTSEPYVLQSGDLIAPVA